MRWVILAALLVGAPRTVSADWVGPPPSRTAGGVAQAASGGGGAAFAPISTGHSFIQASGGTAGPTMTTTGAKLYVVTISTNNAAGSFSDAGTNTYTCSTSAGVSGATFVEICWTLNPTVSSPEEITWFPSGNEGTLTFQAYTDTGSGPLLDTQNNSGSIGSASPVSAGSITPTVANSLVVTSFVANVTALSTVTSPSGYTVTDVPTCTGSSFTCGGQAFLIETSITATNPAWGFTNQSGTQAAAVVVNFKP
jgi:hypothetical protein